jgi:hypothetical protein
MVARARNGVRVVRVTPPTPPSFLTVIFQLTLLGAIFGATFAIALLVQPDGRAVIVDYFDGPAGAAYSGKSAPRAP